MKVFLLFILLLPMTGHAYGQNKTEMEETKIRNLIEECYLNGALNKMITEKMYKGYHADFAIFYADGKDLKKLPLEEWVAMVEDYKRSNNTTGLRNFDYEFTQI